MTADQAIDYALDLQELAGPIDAGPLTRRERRGCKSGCNRHGEPRDRFPSLHLRNVPQNGTSSGSRDKLGVRSRTEVATWAVERGLIPTP